MIVAVDPVSLIFCFILGKESSDVLNQYNNCNLRWHMVFKIKIVKNAKLHA